MDIEAAIKERMPNLLPGRAEELRVRLDRDFRTIQQLLRFSNDPDTFLAIFQAAMSGANRDGMVDAAEFCEDLERRVQREVSAGYAAGKLRELVALNEKIDDAAPF